MELAFQTSQLHFLRRMAQEVRYQEETSEAIVPDSYPDISSIADCYANAILRGKDCRDGSVTISGGIKAGILYVPDDGTYPRHLEFYLPFTVKIENSNLTERSQVISAMTVRSVDARMINSRKAMIRMNLGCEITAYEEEEETLYELQTMCETLQRKESTYPVSLPLETGEKSFVISDTLEIPSGRPPIRQIYKASCMLELADQKLVGNKGVFKGTICCKILYLSENQCLYLWQQKIPFSQYCELQKDYDQEDLTVFPVLTGYDLELDGQEDARRILFNANVLAQCVITGIQPLTLTEDAYCTHGTLTPTWKQYQMDARLDQQRSLQTVRQTLQGNLQEILDTDVYLDFPTLTRQEGQAKAIVPASLRVLGLDENGVLTARTGKAEAVQEFALSDQALCRLIAVPAGENYTTQSSDGTEVRCNIDLGITCFAKQSLHSLCGGSISEEEASESSRGRPSVILRTVQKNDDLWEIAKSCCSTAASIRTVNHIEGDRLSDAAMLLIPVG